MIGWICFAFQLACLVFAVLQFFVAVFNHSGRHTCGFGVPLGYCPASPPILFTILFYFILLFEYLVGKRCAVLHFYVAGAMAPDATPAASAYSGSA